MLPTLAGYSPMTPRINLILCPRVCSPGLPRTRDAVPYNECFIDGLSPQAFFIHAIAGREALVEGATSTAQSGYSMRLGVKMMDWPQTVLGPAPGTRCHPMSCPTPFSPQGEAAPTTTRCGTTTTASYNSNTIARDWIPSGR